MPDSPSVRDPLGSDLPHFIQSCEDALQDLVREAHFISERYNAFTYSNGPATKRPATEWSHLAVQIQVPKDSNRIYVYWRVFKATIQSGGRRLRVSSQISLPRGRLTYRTEALVQKAQPWEREELLTAEKQFAAIRRRSKQISDLLSILNDIRTASEEVRA